MTEKFLKMKHWQLFLLIMGIPMLFQFFMMGTMFTNLASGNSSASLFMFNYMKLFPIMMVLFMGVLYGWLWSVAVGLQYKMPEGVKMKVAKFKIFFFTPLIYIFFFLALIMTFMAGKPNPVIFVVIIPFHLFSMFCMIYILYFVAKTLKTVELQREVNFSDFVGEFFMIWFYPVGIWIVQPKINKIVEE